MGKILVLGLGNLLMGDEGIGIHVIKKLMEIKLPKNIEVVDGGTAAFDLMPYLKAAQKLIIVDAVQTGGKEGAIYRLRPEDLSPGSGKTLSLHQITLQEVLEAAHLLDIKPEVIIIGIEPKQIGCGDELSQELKEVIPAVTRIIKEELSIL